MDRTGGAPQTRCARARLASGLGQRGLGEGWTRAAEGVWEARRGDVGGIPWEPAARESAGAWARRPVWAIASTWTAAAHRRHPADGDTDTRHKGESQ
jgi:hypothetical protein